MEGEKLAYIEKKEILSVKKKMVNKSILIVEDDVDARKGIGVFLESKGFTVHQADSGEQAIKMLKENMYHIVFTDMKMKEIDGIGVLKEAKKLHTRECEVVIMTAYGTIENAVEAMKLGAYDYIAKPIDLDTLNRLIEKCLEKQRLVEEVNGLKEIVNLYVMSRAISSIMELDDLLNLILKLACNSVNTDGGSIMLFDKENKELEVKVASGTFKDKIIGKKFKIGERFAGRAASLRQPLVQEEVKDEQWFKELKKFEQIKSGMSIPMITGDELIGTINLKRTHKDLKFTEKDVKLATIFAQQAAFAINNAWAYDGLKKVNMLKSKFLSNVCFELKTFLMSMKVSLDLLEKGKAGELSTIARELIGINVGGVENMGELIKRIINFSHMEAGTFKITRKRADIKSVIKYAVDKLKPVAYKNNISLTVSLPPEPVEIEIDSQRIGQVVENLIDNGIKYNSPEGKVNVSLKENKKKITVEVSDNGIGIPEENKESIFEKFYIINRSLSGSAHEFGLGLAIAQKIIRLHKGEIIMESRPKRGSRFIFTIPKVEEKE